MTGSTDLSYKDEQYFIDGTVYNCPFCKRRNVRYEVTFHGLYDKSNEKRSYFYLVQCTDADCRKTSFHLTETDITLSEDGKSFDLSPTIIHQVVESGRGNGIRINPHKVPDKSKTITSLDDVFFYHHPTSFFTLDKRIPSEIRKPLSETENCLNSNFLTGASACLRKAIYSLLKHQKIPEGEDYNARIDQLKSTHQKIEDSLFNGLKIVKDLTSNQLHENSWEDIDVQTLRYLLAVTKRVLHEIYILPDDKQKEMDHLAKLKSDADGKKK